MPDISVHVLGDHGPFSRTGKSIGYKLQIGSSVFLLDCGAPLFQQIGGHGLKEIDGLIITHCHDDHKRWFSDFALFRRYAPDIQKKISLFTTQDVHQDLKVATAPALTKSLSSDSKKVVDVAYEEFVECRMMGPMAKYRIVTREESPGQYKLSILDPHGNPLPPDMAKIIINPNTKKPRMLFKDPEYGEWVEPESFYSFSSSTFYEEDKRIFHGDGFSIEALKAPIWHGISSIGIKIKTDKDTLVFSADTVHDKTLWKQLYSEKRARKQSMSEREFESAPVIHGDINDYIERTWSKERYQDAIDAFKDGAVIHDISARNSVVHTDYEKLGRTTLEKDRVMLVHCPDTFTSEWPLCCSGKTYAVKGNTFFEIAGDRLYPLDADIYHKENGKYYVGYRNYRDGRSVYSKDGLLEFVSYDGTSTGSSLYNVDLYLDISGKYFPVLDDSNSMYFERSDGKVELLTFDDGGSIGKIVPDQREHLTKEKGVPSAKVPGSESGETCGDLSPPAETA